MENTIKTDIVAEEVIALMDKFNAILKTIKIGEDYFRHANYILEQMKDPGSYRPIKSINDVVDRGRFYNASTGQWCTREIKGERGREKATDYTKKTSTTLSARDGRIALFNHNNPNVAGFIFDRSKCIIKPKYIFPSNANTDQRWWIKKTNTDEKEHQMVRAIDFDDLCKEIDAVRSQGKVPKQNELLARLRSDSIVGVFSVSDNHKDRCAASFMRAMVYDQLNVVVPLFIVTQSDGIQIYDQQRQVQDLHKSLMLPKKTREYFYATYVLKKFPELSRQMVGRVESPPVVEALPTELSSVVLSYLGEESLKKVICRAIDSDQFSENNETLIEGAIRFFLNTGRESHVNFITSQLIRAVKKKSFFSGLISVFIKHKVHVLLSPEDWDLFQLHLIRFGRPDDFDRFAKYRPLVLSSKIKISLFETYSIAGEKPYIGRKFNISLHNLLTMSVLYNPESYAYFKRNFDSSHVLDDLLKLKLKNEDRFINNSSYYWVWSCGGAKFRSDITIDKKLINDAEQVALNHINDPAYYDNFYDAKVEGKACDNVNSPLLASAYNDQLTAVQYHQQRQQLDYQIKRVLNHSYPNSAGDVKNPQKNFPIAMFISAAIILTTLIFGSLAVAAIIPKSQLDLATGVMDALAVLLNNAKQSALLPWFGTAIFIGSIGGLSTWMSGPTRNLMRAAQDGNAPKIFSRTNRFDAPSAMLMVQGLIFTLLCGVFMLFPKFNSAYWLLSDITSQLSIMVYLLIFAAVIYLSYNQPNQHRPFKIPGGKIGVWLIAGISWITCLVVFMLGFIPPEQLHIVNITTFETILCTGIVATLLSGIIISRKNNTTIKK